MSLFRDHGPVLSDGGFRLLRDAVRERAGIHFADEAKYVVERRLRERLQELHVEDYEAYLRFLRTDAKGEAELQLAIELLTTNETYFFREKYQLDAFANEVLPELHERFRQRRRLVLWSAGCSTGEEVYSLAMLVHETGLFRDWEVRIFGSDISRRVVQHARRAVYGDASFRALPEQYEQYFTGVRGKRQVVPSIRALCHFGHLNLLDRDRAAIVGAVDAIFCRNVLIYFDDEARSEVVQTFYERLVPGGYLFLGHSESLLRTTSDFELVHLSSDLVYRRPQAIFGRPPSRSGS